jgi:FKBP-type peptidyl-prolyl cis-trans isomerase (trigger factor)
VSQLKTMIDKRAEEVLHLRYLAHALARDNNLQVSNEEFKQEMTQLYYNTQAGIQPYIDFSEDISEIQSEVYNQLLTQKVMGLLIDKIRNKS